MTRTQRLQRELSAANDTIRAQRMLLEDATRKEGVHLKEAHEWRLQVRMLQEQLNAKDQMQAATVKDLRDRLETSHQALVVATLRGKPDKMEIRWTQAQPMEAPRG